MTAFIAVGAIACTVGIMVGAFALMVYIVDKSDRRNR